MPLVRVDTKDELWPADGKIPTVSFGVSAGTSSYIVITIVYPNYYAIDTVSFAGVVIAAFSQEFETTALSSTYRCYGTIAPAPGSHDLIITFQQAVWNPISISISQFDSCGGFGNSVASGSTGGINTNLFTLQAAGSQVLTTTITDNPIGTVTANGSPCTELFTHGVNRPVRLSVSNTVLPLVGFNIISTCSNAGNVMGASIEVIEGANEEEGDFLIMF